MTRIPKASIVLAVLAVVAAGCANINPVSVAETPEQRYDAVRMAYDALLEPAVEIVEDESAPLELRRDLQDAIADSGDVYSAGTRVYTEYRAARAAVAAGDSPESRLEIATQNLDEWVRDLNGILDELARMSAEGD